MAQLTPLIRSLRILQRLQTHDGVSVNKLYDIFERRESKQTIRRTIANIQSSNIPVVEPYVS